MSLVVVADLLEERLKGPVDDDADDLGVGRQELVRVDSSLPYVLASMSRRQPWCVLLQLTGETLA